MIDQSKESLAASSILLSGFWLPLVFQDVHAYIDPGTGSLILQVAIASFVGALFFIKVFWGKVKAFLSSLFSRDRKSND